ncbi:MAG: hypothetical protein ACOYK9_05780 [Chlamydiia bacterium]
MTFLEMQREIAKLQTKLDQYETEFAYLNRILLECGFSGGLRTLKATVAAMLLDGKKESID